jgi:hypothetical protein
MHQNILKYKRYRYIKWSALLLLISSILYLTQGLDQPKNGGTIQGYILGVMATVIVLFLTYYGIRKRSYRSRMGTVEAWTSAHVSLGFALMVIASLHGAFQMGWNIHTLAFVLMMLVIVSGFYGLFAYMHFPIVLSKANKGVNQQDWLTELQALDDEIKNLSVSCRGSIRLIVLSAIENTLIGGGLIARLMGKDHAKVRSQANAKNLVSNIDQEKVINVLALNIPNSINQAEAAALNKMLSLFSRRSRVLRLIRRNLQIQVYLKTWLLIHIPLTFALLAALTVHIVVVFIYW